MKHLERLIVISKRKSTQRYDLIPIINIIYHEINIRITYNITIHQIITLICSFILMTPILHNVICFYRYKFKTYYIIQSLRMTESIVYFWGSNQNNLLSPNPNKSYNKPQQELLTQDVEDISASEKHVCYITTDGTLWSYGVNLDGRLGVAGKPDLKYSFLSPCKVKLAAKALKVKCGFSHVCVQLQNNELYAWGLGDYGSLGTGEFKSKSVPTKILVKGKITNFSCGAMHSGFVDSEGGIFTCGSNEYGQLGVNRPQKVATPILINFNHKVKQIECGVFYTLLLTVKGQVYGMGNNKYGQLGIGHKVHECHPTYIKQLQNIVSIAAGYHSGAVDADGNLYIWGSGSFGELLRPKKILLPTPINQIFIRGFFGVAVANTYQNRVYTWGNNTYGQLGRGTFESAKEPLQVQELANIKFNSFACGVNFFLAITKEGDKKALKEEKSYRSRYPSGEGDYSGRRSPYYGIVNNSRIPNQEDLQRQSRRPLNYEPGLSSFRAADDEFKEIARRTRRNEQYRSPSRAEYQAEVIARSRSRQDLLAATQQLRRSRSRGRNYEQLFVSLSADYESLLTRYKIMEDNMELKNRSLYAQSKQLGRIYKEQNDLLRIENQSVRRDLNTAYEEIKNSQNRIINQQFATVSAYANSPASFGISSDPSLKIQNDHLRNELSHVKQELKITLKKLILEEENNRNMASMRGVSPQRFDIQRETLFTENFPEMNSLKEQNSQLTRQLTTLKEDFRATIQELAILKQENESIKAQAYQEQQNQLYRKQESLNQNRSNELLANELKTVKQQFRATIKQLQNAEEELATKSLQVKDLRRKQANADQLSEIQQLLSEKSELAKDMKVVKDELKTAIKKYNQLEQQLAVATLDLRDQKAKKQTSQNNLKQNIAELNEDVTYLQKELKVAREQLKNTLKKLDYTSQELSLKRQVDDEIAQSKKDNKALKEELRTSLKKIDEADKEILLIKKQCNDQIKTLKDEFKNTLRDLQTLNEQLADKDREIRFYQQKQKQSSQSIKQLNLLLKQKEGHAEQLSFHQKQVQSDLYKTIEMIEQDKNRLLQLNERGHLDRRSLEEALTIKETHIKAIEKQYQAELNDAMTNVIKLKEIQDLNEIRVNELKTIIDSHRRGNSGYINQIEAGKLEIANLLSEKKELFKMIEELKSRQGDENQIYKDKIIDLDGVVGLRNEKINQLEIELNYEKEYHNKCEETINGLTDHRDRACSEVESLKLQIQKAKEKNKELGLEVEKNKTLKKQVEVMTLQLERVENAKNQYKKQIEEILLEKEEVIRDLRNDLEKKQKEVDKLEEKNESEVAALNREIKDWEKKLQQKNKDYNEIKKDVERKYVEIDNLKENLDKTQRKLTFKDEQLEKEIQQHEIVTDQFNNLRREHSKLKSEKEDLEHHIDELNNQKRIYEEKIADKKKEIEAVHLEVKRAEDACTNLRKQTELCRKELQESNWSLEESNKVNEELTRANRQFAENEEQYTTKIGQLQGRIFELEDQNKSYTPRYEALLQRNRQMDERNRELSEMINKAIEIQAEAYKTNILKEVEINTGEIIQQINEEQEFKSRGRRREPAQSKSKLDIQNLHSEEPQKMPGIMSKVKEEPYTKFMNQKIGTHKKKVSESAQKLAGILELNSRGEEEAGDNQGDGKSFSRSINMRREQDYEKINSQMESLNQQKSDFMQKISNFAQRLKIL